IFVFLNSNFLMAQIAEYHNVINLNNEERSLHGIGSTTQPTVVYYTSTQDSYTPPEEATTMFVEWTAESLVSAFERARNETACDAKRNENTFLNKPLLAYDRTEKQLMQNELNRGINVSIYESGIYFTILQNINTRQTKRIGMP